MIICCQSFMVYVVNDCFQIVSSRSGNDNMFSTSIDMSLSFVFGCIESSTLQNYIYTDFSPGSSAALAFA